MKVFKNKSKNGKMPIFNAEQSETNQAKKEAHALALARAAIAAKNAPTPVTESPTVDHYSEYKTLQLTNPKKATLYWRDHKEDILTQL